MRVPASLLAALTALVLAGCAERSGPPISTARFEDRIDHAPQEVAILDQGFDSLVGRIATIRSARQRIDVQTFIYVEDAAGEILLEELAAAADRGVRVRLLVDAMFCGLAPGRLAWLRQHHPGFAIALYNPRPSEVVEAREKLQDEVDAGRNHRMHNKLLVVDGTVGITGGRNHEDAYFDIGQGLNYRDREVAIRGVTARQMSACASAWWFHPLAVPVDQLIAVRDAAPLAAPEALAPRLAALRAAVAPAEKPSLAWHPVAHAAFWWDIPGRVHEAEDYSTARAINRLVTQAEKRIVVTSPYCVLTSASLANVRGISERGVELAILTNSLASTDAWWAFGGYLRDRRRLVATGVDLNELRPAPAGRDGMWSIRPEIAALRAGGREPFLSLHAKCMTVDGRFALIGTFNLDPRSTHTNTEQALVVDDAALTGELDGLMRSDSAPENAWRVGPRDLALGWFHAPLVRLSEWTGDWLSLDLYPVQPTTCFDLVPGKPPVPVGNAEFPNNWKDAGPTPEAEAATARNAGMIQTFGAAITPLL